MSRTQLLFKRIIKRLKAKYLFEIQKLKRLLYNILTLRLHTPGRSRMDEKYSNRYISKTKKLLENRALPNYHHYEFELLNTLSAHNSASIRANAQNCFKQNGIYPISFSIPYSMPSFSSEKRNFLLSPIQPRQPYKYESFDDYMDTYSKSSYAITFKKGGWDCARHFEIMSAGCLPLMLDVDQIPQFTMTHYPKQFLARVKTLSESGYQPTLNVHLAVYEWAANFLTSSNMSRYYLEKIEKNFSSILFVDESLPNGPDYLSLHSLIGLKNLFGQEVHELRKTPYIYTDYKLDTTTLYGRGFGYSKVIDKNLRDSLDFPSLTTVNEYQHIFREYDLVVVGNLSNNPKVITALEGLGTSTAKVYLRGNDLAPTKKESKKLAMLNGIVFSREIY